MDMRHKRRIKIVQNLYTLSFHTKKNSRKFLNDLDEKTKKIIKQKSKIHKLIEKYASKFPIDHIAKIDLAILELSIYELLFEKKEPPKVIIDEGVELAKELGGDRSFAFINAILGKVFQEKYEK